MLGIRGEVGHKFHEATWMVGLMITQMKAELLWLRHLKQEINRRTAAYFPQYPSE